MLMTYLNGDINQEVDISGVGLGGEAWGEICIGCWARRWLRKALRHCNIRV